MGTAHYEDPIQKVGELTDSGFLIFGKEYRYDDNNI
jgi:hypothetical protein